jgi:hypothetical protein
MYKGERVASLAEFQSYLYWLTTRGLDWERCGVLVRLLIRFFAFLGKSPKARTSAFDPPTG